MVACRAGRALAGEDLAKRQWMDATLLPLIVSTVHYAILIGALLAVLDQFGIQMTSLVAVLGAAGLAIGLALQGTLFERRRGRHARGAAAFPCRSDNPGRQLQRYGARSRAS